MMKRAIFIGITLMNAAPALLAAADDGFNAPPFKGKTPWIAIGYAVGGLMLIGLCAFRNARRSHLD